MSWILPEGTLTVGGFAAILGLLIKAYNLGKSDGKIRKDLDGVAAREKDKREKHEIRINNLEKAVLLVSKNDPEGRRIAKLLGERVDDPSPKE